ncbi:MAG: NAD-dependent epimerase/dehydratase family protein [Candidatus Methanoperedens sp.]
MYGKRDFDRVIPIFIKNSLNNKDLIVYGGEQILDFVYVSDVIDAFIKALDINENIIVNAGSGKGISLNELANIINNITKNKGEIIIKEKRKGEVERFVANLDTVQKILHWKPEIRLEDGLKRLLKDMYF